MARAIDAKELEKKLSEWLGQPGNGDYYSGYDAALCAVQDLIADMPTLTPPNEPLSIEQLREMDGKPVFLVDRTWLNLSAWGIVSVFNEGDGEKAYVYIHRGQKGTVTYPDQECGNCWLAYRRPPEGEDAK